MLHGLYPYPNDFLKSAEFVSCRAIWCSVMETQTYPPSPPTHTLTFTPASTFLPHNPDTLPCFHAPPLLTTRGAKNRWQYDEKGWKRKNRRKGGGRESKETQLIEDEWRKRWGKKEKQDTQSKTVKREESSENEEEKKECDIMSPGCQAEPNSVLLVV